MRHFIDLMESVEETPELKSVETIEALRSELVKAAQEQYDAWQLDDDGFDFEVGAGGICHLIADAIVDILNEHGIECSSVSATHEVHVYVLAQVEEGIYEIDVPHRIYETGGGYTWKKIEGVTFEPDHVVIYCIDRDPENFAQYIEE